MQQSSIERPKRPQEPLPEAREVAPGIWKFTLPIPFPLRTVNMHAIVGNDGWALIDAGMGMPDSRKAFSAGLERAGLSIDTLRVIVLSHDHPDHIGLSGELYEKTGATIYMHSIDAENMRLFWNGTIPERFKKAARFFEKHGMPRPDRVMMPSSNTTSIKWYDIIRVPPHEAITTVEDGETIDLLGEQYRVIWTPGHSDGHICLFRERDGVFLAADHVLPRITPNIGLYSEDDRQNPLGDYIDSLHKVSTLPARIVLPGHGEPFVGLKERAEEIISHHEQREQQILGMITEQPQHAYSISEQLFGHRAKSNDTQRMAFAETLSHLEYMRYEGLVEQQKEDGVILYAAV